jgi:hypothetical protein
MKEKSKVIGPEYELELPPSPSDIIPLCQNYSKFREIKTTFV